MLNKKKQNTFDIGERHKQDFALGSLKLYFAYPELSAKHLSTSGGTAAIKFYLRTCVCDLLEMHLFTNLEA